MRFVGHGPLIPAELLYARDEGRVVFFCGAGVSLAAGLPNFLELAKLVIASLGVPVGDKLNLILSEIEELDKRVGATGLVSVDRIFGLLEREFSPHQIATHVASALKPSGNVNLRCHEIMARLSATQNGEPRLVTTNFDRLFEQALTTAKVWDPSDLPSFDAGKTLSGVVHLHGVCDNRYELPIGEGFVLSPREFGAAYIADGWATRFVKDLLARYIVVFVGYSADDPPMNYLLEGLNRGPGATNGLYAFFSADGGEAAKKWRARGVNAVPYESGNGHAALWDTFEEWARRGENPAEWRRKIVALAGRGPESLAAHERGQVAHLVSTQTGSLAFSQAKHPPPATWLFTFDPARRYATPRQTADTRVGAALVDPFSKYSLDSDPTPQPSTEGSTAPRHTIPIDAWDAFAPNAHDAEGINFTDTAGIRGSTETYERRLSPRLFSLGGWLAKVSGTPEAIWWAVRQLGLHPNVRFQIQDQRSRYEGENAQALRLAWDSLFEIWDGNKDQSALALFQVCSRAKLDGWDIAKLRRYFAERAPRLKLDSLGPNQALPNRDDPQFKTGPWFRSRVRYPRADNAVSFPKNFDVDRADALLRLLESAVALETICGSWELKTLPPIIADDDPEIDRHQRGRGIFSLLREYCDVLVEIAKSSPEFARRHVAFWPRSDEYLFARLRIWASGNRNLVTPSEAARSFSSLPRRVFWWDYHQRDLLVSLRDRWGELSDCGKLRIAAKLFVGPEKLPKESAEDHARRRGRAAMEKFRWLEQGGYKFSSAVRSRLDEVRSKSELSQRSDPSRSLEMRGGWVQVNSDPSGLANIPIGEIVSESRRLAGRDIMALQEARPFEGLCKARPRRAILAILAARGRLSELEHEWSTFLWSEERLADSVHLKTEIAKVICLLPRSEFDSALRPICVWRHRFGLGLGTVGDRILDLAIESFERASAESGTAVVDSDENPHWGDRALNSPVGDIARALFGDLETGESLVGRAFPIPWVQRATRLVGLPEKSSALAITIFAHALEYLFVHEPGWVKSLLLPYFQEEKGIRSQAAWAGLFWANRLRNAQLFLELKANLLVRVMRGQNSRSDGVEFFAVACLGAWLASQGDPGDRHITDSEFRDALLSGSEGFRLRILFHLRQSDGSGYLKIADRYVLPDFVSRVWPQQLSIRSAAISSELIELALSCREERSEVARLVLPLLTKVGRNDLSIFAAMENGGRAIKERPEEALALLSTSLPDEPNEWPYRTLDALATIVEAAPGLQNDERYLKLQRRAGL